MRKKIFCIGLTRGAKAGQKSLVPDSELRAQRTNQGRAPFICTVPICLSFNSQQERPPLSSLSRTLPRFLAVHTTPYPLSCLSFSFFLRVPTSDVRGGGCRAESYDRKEAWPFIKHSILSAEPVRLENKQAQSTCRYWHHVIVSFNIYKHSQHKLVRLPPRHFLWPFH